MTPVSSFYTIDLYEYLPRDSYSSEVNDSTDTAYSEGPQRKRVLSQTEESEGATKHYKPEEEWFVESIITMTNETLSGCFIRGELVGRCISETSSMVFSVEDLNTTQESSKVLKITDSFPPFEVLDAVRAIWENQVSIHLTKTVLLGKIAVRTGAYLDLDNKHGGFVHPPRVNQKKRRWAYVYCMPRKEGDLKALKQRGLSVIEEAAIEVQRVATEALLNAYGIEPEDIKDINILTQPLKLEDCFQGKRISVYDYLKYTIESQSYFLPRGGHIITLCDYDKWTMTSVKKDYSNLLEFRLQRAPHLLAEIEKFKIIPPEHCRILSMN